ncbi:MAG: hypothetical protein R3293_11670 [Candidatus Promineifilaceae bacterium]|nr:hypothetical protein [Candidatus Promineifilaceae bacterium]
MSNKHAHVKKHPPRSKKGRKHHEVHKERNFWLAAAIFVVIIHGLLMLGIIYGDQLLRQVDGPPTWFVLSVLGAAVADIVAGIALWRWKKWGLTLYFISTVVVIGLGILATGYAMMWAFSRLIPFVIVGYIIRSRWQYFE